MRFNLCISFLTGLLFTAFVSAASEPPSGASSVEVATTTAPCVGTVSN